MWLNFSLSLYHSDGIPYIKFVDPSRQPRPSSSSQVWSF